MLVGLLMPTGTAHADPTPPLSQEGRFIFDAQGRVVLTQGVNMVYKVPPYYPAAAGFGRDDAEFLARQGLNTVRLGVIYKGVEPTPGVYDEAYLDQIATTVRELSQAGIFVLLDFHQDLYNERFQGEGWPDWAVYDDGLPAEPKLGFPGNYIGMPALIRAFDNFWANVNGPGDVGLQERYAAAWRHVAVRFKDERYVMGYDLMNEPWPGSPWTTCANNVGCPVFDTMTLQAFNERVTAAIREVDTRNIVWYEPNVLYNNGPQTHLADVPGEAGMSFHVYCLEEGTSPDTDPVENEAEAGSCALREELPFTNAVDHSAKTGNALLNTEFGASDDLGEIGRIIDNAERFLIGWQYWHYCNCDDPTTSGSGGRQSVVNEASKPPSGSHGRTRRPWPAPPHAGASTSRRGSSSSSTRRRVPAEAASARPRPRRSSCPTSSTRGATTSTSAVATPSRAQTSGCCSCAHAPAGPRSPSVCAGEAAWPPPTASRRGR
jgi:endoglycosylceramidase